MLTSKASILRRNLLCQKYPHNLRCFRKNERSGGICSHQHQEIKCKWYLCRWYLCSEASTHEGICNVVNPSPGSWCIQGLEVLHACTTVITPESKGVFGCQLPLQLPFIVSDKKKCVCAITVSFNYFQHFLVKKKRRGQFVCCPTKGEMFPFFPFLAHIRHPYIARKSCTWNAEIL